MSNTQAINDLILKGRNAAEMVDDHAQRALAYAALAQAAATFDAGLHIRRCSEKIDRLADVVNAGKSWR